jgi:hypothetical protein
VGKDPFRRSPAPQFDIPGGLEPAMLGFVMRMGYHRNLFSATITNLAANKRIKINRPKKRFTLTRLKSKNPIASSEESVLDALLPSDNSTLP